MHSRHARWYERHSDVHQHFALYSAFDAFESGRVGTERDRHKDNVTSLRSAHIIQTLDRLVCNTTIGELCGERLSSLDGLL